MSPWQPHLARASQALPTENNSTESPLLFRCGLENRKVWGGELLEDLLGGREATEGGYSTQGAGHMAH